MEGVLLKESIIGVVVPEASNTTIADALAEDEIRGDLDSESLLPSIKQRSLLFFDEQLTAYVVLQFPVNSNAALRELLPRLDLRLDVFAINGQPNENDARRSQDQPGAGRDMIFSQKVEKIGDPFLALNEAEADEGSKAFAIWEVDVVLNRPRLRLPSPAVVFSAVGAIRPVKGVATDADDEDLPPFQPPPMNILDAFKADPAMKDGLPYLSSATLSRILPNSGPRASLTYLPSHPSEPIRIIPAVSARVRYSRMNNFSPRPRTIASLDFEVTPFIRHDVKLDVADVVISDNGIIDPITKIGLPIVCRPRDDLTFLYTLIPSDQPHGPGTSTSMIATLDICLSANIHVSSVCTPRITMRWRTSVDFTMALNPSYGAPSQILQRNNRPTNLSTLSSNSIPTTSTFGGPASLTSTSPDTSLTITFSAPATPVKLGTIFSWSVLIVNHSPRTRKLALVAITSRPPPRRPQSAALNTSNTTQARPSSTSTHPSHTQSHISQPHHPHPDVAPAYLDDNTLHALQHTILTTNSHNSSPLICMSPDIRIGPLGSGAAHECDMRFLALRKGWLRVEGVRIVDVGSSERNSITSSIEGGEKQQAIEWFVKDVPDIWVVDNTDEMER